MQRVTGTSRRLAIWGAVVAAAIVPSTAGAGGGGGGADPEAEPVRHRHGDHHRHRDGLSLAGRAISRTDAGSYAIQIRAHRTETDGAEAAGSGGWVRYGHRTGDDRLALEGRVTCLDVTDGVAHLSGTVHRGDTRPRAERRDRGSSISPEADPEAFLDSLFAEFDADTSDGQDRDGSWRDRRHRSGGALAGSDFAFTVNVTGDPQQFSAPNLAEAGTLPACSGGEGALEVTRGGFRTTQTEGGRAPGRRRG